ncbi:MAG TPA: cupin domain-containing protein [Paludibacteraceae bacterium]|nr:cupin domain-containing protein [Paludibacteraceae bacterium]HPS26211.1 cupin domain-containing protein [Bacteroidales bacterium]
MSYTADFWIAQLQLQPHPEGGYFKEVYRSEEMINAAFLSNRYQSERCFATSIYFLLKSGQISAFHRLQSDEIWHFYSGSSIRVYIINAAGILSETILGRDVLSNELLHLVIPHGCWFAAEVNRADSYSLIGCTVAPGFDFRDFELATKAGLTELFPSYSRLFEKMCIR